MTVGLQLPDAVGDYEILRPISQGGMGAVLLARKQGARGFEKIFAVKVLLPGMQESADVRDLFFSEARLAARLSHPNVCQVFDFGEQDGLYYLVMEYVDGVNVADLMFAARERGGLVPLPLAARIVADAARGLHHAHTSRGADGRPLNVVHRDVSPQNLQVTRAGCVKVLDFGIAKSNERDRATQHGMLRGKPAYMSPEQSRGEPLDPRSDVFSLGAVCYELLTGRNPFIRDGVYATLQAVASQPAPDPRAERPDLPEAAARIVNCALAPSPSDRFASADQMARACEQMLQQLSSPVGSDALADYLAQLFDPARLTPVDVPAGPRGRSPSQETAQALGGATAPARPADTGATTRSMTGAPAASGRRGVLLLLLAGLVASALGSLWWLADAQAPEIRARLDAGPPAAALLPAAAPVKAAAPAVDAALADAAQANEAAPHRRAARRNPRRTATPPAPRPAAAPPADAGLPAPASPQPVDGALRVTSQPYGEVYVDGLHVGVTPIRGHRLSSGAHTVEIREAGSGRTVLRREVEIQPRAETWVRYPP